ncbi:MAG: hypothetical protein OEN01_15480 [Candidatus Krumholzibacteria bacterium]|nr:hypothetical protein [Candidatus Krumholzibacteria bacterium]
MKKYWVLILVVGLTAGCQKKHPIKVEIDPVMRDGSVQKIAVFPFATAVHHTDDPDGEAPRMMDLLFRHELDTRDDYQFVSPSSVEYALQGEGLMDQAGEFVDNWRNHGQVDREFLKQLSVVLQADAVLIGVVDLWQKDEIDYRETAAPATYVGATVTILRLSDGMRLFEASDEDFLEGAYSEAADRGARRSGSGAVQSDRAASVYKAPEYKEVALKVVRALALSIPGR